MAVDGEFNPDHPVTRELHNLWYKMAAAIMLKAGWTEVVLTIDDLQRIDGKAILAKPSHDTITIRLVTMEEGERIAKEEGGYRVDAHLSRHSL